MAYRWRKEAVGGPLMAPPHDEAPVPGMATGLQEIARTKATPESELTLIATQPTETDKSDITDFPTSNAELLRAIFKALPDPYRPFVLGFAGKPKDRKAWGGDAYRADKINVDNPALNWYFSLAVYGASDDGYHRREKDCAAVYGVMLDDLGTKALPLDRLDACPPSYIIETSAGNFQAGYLFTSACTNFASIKALNQSMVEAGLCDPGAKSPTTRYGRMPFASNGKSDPAFECKLIEWHPERRYSVEDIIDRLELPPPQEKVKPGRKAAAVDRSADDIYTPRADENAVIVALKARGLYKQPLGSGKHDVTCPWVHEHTDQTDHGSAYFEPSDLYPIGGFKCQHAHGDVHRIGALLEFLSVTFIAAKHKPTIKVEAGELHRIVDAAERELAETKRYYQRGGLIVSINTDPESAATEIKPVSQPGLLRALSSAAIWTRFDGRSQADVVCDPPARHVTVLFDSEGYQHLPALTGIARQPHLRPDGSLVREAGFDPATGLFGVFDGRQFNIADQPTRQQAEHALCELRELLGEFEFAKPHDLAAALSGLLTATIRPSLPLAPMLHVRAPQIASGKSYLTSLIVAFASPTSPAAVAFPTNDEECQKLLLATLLSAPGAIVFDNLTTDLIPFKSLCSALTEEHLTGRILGVSKTATVGTRALFLSSGNNVDAVRDMSRRCITVNLDPQCETPATRQFGADPLSHVRANRARYVSLALTVIRAWLCAGKPMTVCKPLASFSQWSDLVRQPLLWLGQHDPATSVFEQLAQDPDRETLGRLLHAWHNTFADAPAMIREAVEKSNAAFAEVLREVAEERGEINRRRLGRWIARHQGRIVDGMRFERDSGTSSAEKWRVKSVMSVLKVSLPEVAQSVENLETVTEDL
ncbi:DNA-primase RepB domain-containing protein [Rhodoferax ferrireducens]|uniref:DNA-primase RepB domain-containing protein n=1 Tax=Rhodoferax ferrireducens TaxID=192843 RepID=UPI00298DE286|nr:DNA-primase RepB domain-containing protein [Rhodoferax ferrireducens]WPC65677.1 DNA-primase RepB domain-containing protein [Rhodoferax ferrireducens]